MLFDAHFDALMRHGLEDFEAPALALAVVKDDQVIFARGYGVRTLGGSQPVDERSLFAIASISKSSVPTCLAMLVDEGRLGWDDPVAELLPGFRLYDDFATRHMRLRDLLIHNSGLGEVSGGTIWYGSDFSREEVIRRLRYVRPVSSFRSQYAYQNTMYLVAGQVIQAVSGLSWDDFLEQRVFAPLGMLDSTSRMAVLRERANVATPHALIHGEVAAIPYRSHDNVGPAAAVNTNAWELAQYARLHLGQGAYAGQQLIRPATARELHTPQMTARRAWSPWMGRMVPHFFSYGLGWFLQDYLGRKVVWHSGGVDGMRSLLTLIPEENLGVVALCNHECALTYAASYTIIDAFLGAEPEDWFGRAAKAGREFQLLQSVERHKVAAGRVRGTHPALPLEGYAGRYFDPLVDDLPVTLEDGRLVLRFSHTPGFTADLEHWHYDTFRLVWRDAYIPDGLVTFRFNSHGRVEGLKFDQPNLLDVDFSELDVTRAGDW
ncbi:MAG: serine hydrolase [Chloroflexi bacterium]|nr:serine hydrolase [Chloroflexota bacterium]